MCVDPLASNYPSSSHYNFVLNNPLSYIDPNGMEVVPSREKGIDYEETEAIVAVAERYSPSWWDPFTYASLILFGNRNYHEVLFNKDAGMEALAVLPITFIPGGSSSKGATSVIKATAIGFVKGTGKSVLNPKRLQHAARHLIKAKLLPNWSNATKVKFEKIVIEIVENPTRTIDHIQRGGTPAKGFVGSLGGREIVVFVAKEGGQVAAGDIITVVPK